MRRELVVRRRDLADGTERRGQSHGPPAVPVAARVDRSEVPTPTVLYRQHAPIPVLAPYVDCLWRVTCALPRGESVPHRVLPDGCVDLVLDLTSPESGGMPALVVGAMRRPRVVALGGATRLLGVRFAPGAASPLLRLPAGALRDSDLSLDDVSPPLAAAITAALERFLGRPGGALEDACGVAHGEEVVGIEMEQAWLEQASLALAHGLASEAVRDVMSVDPLVRAAVAAIRAAQGQMTVATLSRALAVGPRLLERRFREHVGVPPKAFAQIVRMQAIARVVRNTPGHGSQPSWAALACDAGFHDQAHFVRTFRTYAGVTPGTYARAHGRGASGDLS
jgi:AraC-like DNA-binding protein